MERIHALKFFLHLRSHNLPVVIMTRRRHGWWWWRREVGGQIKSSFNFPYGCRHRLVQVLKAETKQTKPDLALWVKEWLILGDLTLVSQDGVQVREPAWERKRPLTPWESLIYSPITARCWYRATADWKSNWNLTFKIAQSFSLLFHHLVMSNSLCDTMDCSMSFSILHHLQGLLKFMSVELIIVTFPSHKSLNKFFIIPEQESSIIQDIDFGAKL